MTGGTFDLLHYGHVLHLDACEELAGQRAGVFVMLITDRWGEERKGKNRPVLGYEERKAILVGLRINPENIIPVDRIDDLAACVESIRPDSYVYELETNREAHEKALAVCGKLGIKTVDMGKKPTNPFGTSTSTIIERIRG